MTGRDVSRHAYGLTVVALAAGIGVLAAFLVLVVLPDIGVQAAIETPTPVPTLTAAPTPDSGMALSPIGIEMPKDADCEACHLTTAGSVGTKLIPRLGHPVWGFRNCTECHARDSIVDAAPGHSSLHTQDCLVCHQVDPAIAGGTSGAPMRPEHMGAARPSTASHGVDEHPPMPDAMANRENCWICHNGEEFTYLFESASPDPSPVGSASPGPDGASVGTRWVLVRP